VLYFSEAWDYTGDMTFKVPQGHWCHSVGIMWQTLCAWLYVTWQWNVASQEREQVDTSTGWDEND